VVAERQGFESPHLHQVPEGALVPCHLSLLHAAGLRLTRTMTRRSSSGWTLGARFEEDVVETHLDTLVEA
jgi:hypothetical protein